MHIERVELDGFGRFHDARWTFGAGLTVLLGNNEAGKTTLLNAVRALLFGFESTRDGRTWYPAMAGGRRGGRLTLRTASDERWIVERHGERGGGGALAVRAPNGNQGGQETLDRLLRGADRDLFNNIFAFGLGELQSFASLSTDGVRGRIYGAGAGIGGTSVVDFERRLRQQQEATFLPRGREKPLNALLARIDELRGLIADLAAQPEEHEAAHRERRELEARAETLRGRARAQRQTVARLQQLRAAAPLAAELRDVEAQLAAGDDTLDVLPADAVAVLDRRLAAASEARAVLGALDEQLDAARATRAGLQIDEPVLAAADEITALDEERAVRAAAVVRRTEIEIAEARHAAAVAEQLTRAGGWDEERLTALDDSIASIEASREMEASLATARTAHSVAEQRRHAAADELLAREREAVTEGAEGTQLAERTSLVRQLDELRLRGVAVEARAQATGVPTRLAPRRPVALGLAVALVALGALAGAPLGLALPAAALGGAIGLLLVLLSRMRPAAAGDEAAEIAAARGALLERLGLPPDAGHDRVAELADELAALRARNELVAERGASLEARRAELDGHQRAATRAGEALVAAESAWRAWLTSRCLPGDISPEAARQVLAAAGAARRAATERDHQRELLDALATAERAFVARADALLAVLGLPVPTDASRREALLAGAASRLVGAREDRRRARELDAAIEQLRARREPAAAAMADREAAVAEHLAAVGCPDPDALRRRNIEASARRDLQARARELRSGLAGIAGGAGAVAELLKATAAMDPGAVDAERVEAEEELASVEHEERDALSRIGALGDRIRQLEAAEELGSRRQELAALEGQALAMARGWAVRALALRLFEETRARYERERQPDVVRAAESHFERFTGGRYARIVAPPGEGTVRVETEGGESRVTDELSRGTAEQLYLALRFGLIEEFARHAEPLPVVMDDILVNFDAVRAASAVAAIRELATRHQVLYFTCHRATAQLVDPDGVATVALDHA